MKFYHIVSTKKEFKKVTDGLYTEFAPAERDAQESITRLFNIINEQPLLKEVINAIPEIFLILNSKRQIVFGNARFLEFLNQKEIKNSLGKRPGEILNCIYSNKNPGGCGTTLFCRECGAVKAILESYQGIESTYECHILSENNKAYEFRVYASPHKLGNEQFTFFSIQDISHEKRRKAIERVFFHDIMNTFGNLSTIAKLLKESPDTIYELNEILSQVVEELRGLILFHKQLLAAENGELILDIFQAQSIEILNNLKAEYQHSPIAEGKKIIIAEDSINISFESDIGLVKRVISNLLKNALEATEIGKEVTLKSSGNNDEVIFTVHNDAFIPQNIQSQIFQRSFSTKGVGRGLGTYSVKLFTENYLKGKVEFVSKENEGTTFTVKLKTKFPG